jgi:hypothetical protein
MQYLPHIFYLKEQPRTYLESGQPLDNRRLMSPLMLHTATTVLEHILSNRLLVMSAVPLHPAAPPL